MRLKTLLRSLYGRFQHYRLQQAEQRALRADLRQLRDMGLCGPADLAAVVDGTYAFDPTRRHGATGR